MISPEALTINMELPPVTQIGVVVKDLDKSMELYSKTFGIGPFDRVFEVVPDKNWYMGEQSPVRLKAGQARWGTMEYELIQPMEGKSVHQDFLDVHGEGLHHLAVDVRDYDEIVQKMTQARFRELQTMENYIPLHDAWVRASFFDIQDAGGIILEVIHRPWLYKKSE